MTDGRLTVKVYSAGELVPAFEAYDAVMTGTADLYHASEYNFVGKSKSLAFFTTVPMGMTATEFDAWIHHQGGQELWDELAATFNVKSFPAGNTGAQMGGWFNKEIKTLDDIKGLKMRMPGMGAKSFAVLEHPLFLFRGAKSSRLCSLARLTQLNSSVPGTIWLWASTRPPNSTTILVSMSQVAVSPLV